MKDPHREIYEETGRVITFDPIANNRKKWRRIALKATTFIGELGRENSSVATKCQNFVSQLMAENS